MKTTCELWEDYFEPANNKASRYKLKRIKSLKPWPLNRVLMEKYKICEIEATLFSKFLNRMLKWSPKNRASAKDLLDDPWLKVGPIENKSHMSRTYLKNGVKQQANQSLALKVIVMILMKNQKKKVNRSQPKI